ncbi:MAG: energy transducer TonB [Porphyrobacter sp.]|nr:energy transducer TonB [Porphyrobacter sp.]
MVWLALAPDGAIGQVPPPSMPQGITPPPPPIRVEPIAPVVPDRKPDSFPAAPEPLNDPLSWVTSTDYPPQALSEGHEGRTGFELSVLPNGRAFDCLVTASSGWAELDQAACRLVPQRARFRPAYDAAGKTVAGTYRNTIAWRLPEAPNIAPFAAQFVFVLATDGTIHDCRVVSMTGEVPRGLLMNNPCTDRRRHAPYRDAAGRPVRKQVTLTYGSQVHDVPVASQATAARRRR